MNPTFRLLALAHEQFEPLFSLSNEALRSKGIVRRVATQTPGFPCRVSLEDAQIGDELLLLPFVHHAVESPYRASGPIFVRRGARTRQLVAGEVPPYVTQRLMSIRAYDATSMMLAAEVCDGTFVAAQLERFFADKNVAYAQLHNAKHGCYSCQAVRAD
jgi:hypothetical protein